LPRIAAGEWAMVFVFNPFHIEQKSKNTMLGCVGDEPLLMQGALK
jgi:hypothetical protein